MSERKTELKQMSNKLITPKCTHDVNSIDLAQKYTFKHLGTRIISDGPCVAEIKDSTGHAQTAFRKIKTI